jgi:23S rRNA (pseudouridine1915-N3)-methyltransferase
MKLKIAWIGKTKDPSIRSLTSDYLRRVSRYIPTESLELHSEAALLKQFEKSGSRLPPLLVLLDSRGREFSSEQFADFLRQHQARGTQLLCFAVGPADGFSPAARSAASATLSLGRMTLPHELARVVLLEQIYRAFTIIAGHPYHCGH